MQSLSTHVGIFVLLVSLTRAQAVQALPSVAAAPAGMSVPCVTRPLPFTFDPHATGFDRGSAFWMMWMSLRAFTSEQKATRQELAALGFKDYTALADPWTGLRGFIAASSEAVVISFRGTTKPVDWLVDLSIALVDGTPFQLAGRVHQGFSSDLASSWPTIQALVDKYGQGRKPIWISGHSLGGALATVAAYRLASLGYPVAPLYTFAAPRSGDSAYSEAGYARLHGEHYRFTYDQDLVPHVPIRASSARWLTQLAPGPLGVWLEHLFRSDLEYAHYGHWVRFDQHGQEAASGLEEAGDDDAYWQTLGELAASTSPEHALELLFDKQRQIHDQKRYFCLMHEYFLTGP